MPVPDDLAAEIAALEQTIAEADDACDAAEYLGPDEDPNLEIFFAAVRRLERLKNELSALWSKVAGDRFVHKGSWRHH